MMNRDGPGRRSYHHGNLREALVQAALDMIGQRGLAGLAIAEIARVLGVSPAAPYRHFRDRSALIAAVARRGFERLTTDLDTPGALAVLEVELACVRGDGRPARMPGRWRAALAGVARVAGAAAGRDADQDKGEGETRESN